MSDPRKWLELMRGLKLPRPVKIMNVCGGHERTITVSGLRSLLPPGVELIPGPGCPVCVCPEHKIHSAIRIALSGQARLAVFGDMMRVPVAPLSEAGAGGDGVAGGGRRSGIGSLEEARAAGGAIHPVASPLEVLRLAREEPERPLVLFAAGFETTMAPVAALLVQGIPANCSLLIAGRLTWPAVALLLESGTPGFQGLVAPGHVAAVTGPEEWQFVAARHGIPVAVAGFTPELLLEAFHLVLKQIEAGRAVLENAYPQVVRSGGNPTARSYLERAFRVEDAWWRGVGVVPDSGYRLRPEWSAHDATLRFADLMAPQPTEGGDLLKGCECAAVVLGRITPDQCRLYGTACTPRKPHGPCMVSEEGACRIWQLGWG